MDKLLAEKDRLLGEMNDLDSRLICAFGVIPNNYFKSDSKGETFSDLDCSVLGSRQAPLQLVPSLQCREHVRLLTPLILEHFKSELKKYKPDGVELQEIRSIIDFGPLSRFPCKKCVVCAKQMEHVKCLSVLRSETLGLLTDFIQSVKFLQSKLGVSSKWDKVLRCKVFFSLIKSFIEQCVQSFLE